MDKTSNLLVDDLRLDVGAVVGLDVARSAPGHWVTLAVELAAWQIGATVSVDTPAAEVDLLVLGPDWRDADLQGAEAVLACSMHPMGLGFPEPLPAPVVDFALEVRGQADVYPAAPRPGSELAWVDGTRQLTQADLVAVREPHRDGGSRRLVQVSDPWSSTRDGLLVPILTEGSAVLVTGSDPARLDRIRQDERVD